MNARKKLDEFADLTGMNKNQLIGWSIASDFAEWYAEQVKNCNIPHVITLLLTDKDIENFVWEEFALPLSKIDIDINSSSYIQYLDAVHWAKWGRDNSNGL